MTRRSITTVLLDLDGTLLDSNEAHAVSWTEVLTQFGFKVSLTNVRNLIGMGTDHLLPLACGIDSDTAKGKEIARAREKIYKTYFKNLKPFKGARELVERFKSERFELVIATSASKEDLHPILEKIGIQDMIRLTVTAGDVDRTKPEPDIILKALEKSNSVPAQAIMIGDTPYDIAAAAGAGVRTVAFTCGGRSKEDLKSAIAIYSGPDDLLSRLNGSIFFT